jgi:hypothetical protein
MKDEPSPLAMPSFLLVLAFWIAIQTSLRLMRD